jgi:saccharopine dehydrogenase (NADP+, L-glutamate forming)
MAKTVGLPLGIAARLLLQNKITSRGVVIPVMKEIYEPVLHELSTLGITMTEREIH